MREFAKTGLLAFFIVLTTPVWLIVNTISRFERGNQSFLSGGQLMSLFPGLTGMLLHRAYYVMTLRHCARDCGIEFGTWISNRETRIGKRVYIGSKCTIGMATIDDDVLIGSNVDILSGKNQHRFSDPDTPKNRQGGFFERVHIEANSWIGNSSVIMADVGANAVVGAGSVVVKPVRSGAIAVGNPARHLDKKPASVIQNEN